MTLLLGITLVSVLLAAIMSGIAWRAARAERARSAARVAALASEIQSAVAAAGGRREPTLRAVRPQAPAAADLFSAAPSTSSSRSVAVVGIALTAFAVAVTLLVVLTSGARRGNVTRSRTGDQTMSQTAGQPAGQTGPIELIALGQDRAGDRLTVRGVVRNPTTNHAIGHVTAVVFGFDKNGGFVASGRATLDDATLVAGGESAFTVAVPDAANIVRYRVSFRTDTAVVPHLDKRHAD